MAPILRAPIRTHGTYLRHGPDKNIYPFLNTEFLQGSTPFLYTLIYYEFISARRCTDKWQQRSAGFE